MHTKLPQMVQSKICARSSLAHPTFHSVIAHRAGEQLKLNNCVCVLFCFSEDNRVFIFLFLGPRMVNHSSLYLCNVLVWCTTLNRTRREVTLDLHILGTLTWTTRHLQPIMLNKHKVGNTSTLQF